MTAVCFANAKYISVINFDGCRSRWPCARKPRSSPGGGVRGSALWPVCWRSCHEQARAFTNGRALSPGSIGGLAHRNAQPLGNSAWNAASPLGQSRAGVVGTADGGAAVRRRPGEMGYHRRQPGGDSGPAAGRSRVPHRIASKISGNGQTAFHDCRGSIRAAKWSRCDFDDMARTSDSRPSMNHSKPRTGIPLVLKRLPWPPLFGDCRRGRAVLR